PRSITSFSDAGEGGSSWRNDVDSASTGSSSPGGFGSTGLGASFFGGGGGGIRFFPLSSTASTTTGGLNLQSAAAGSQNISIWSLKLWTAGFRKSTVLRSTKLPS